MKVGLASVAVFFSLAAPAGALEGLGHEQRGYIASPPRPAMTYVANPAYGQQTVTLRGVPAGRLTHVEAALRLQALQLQEYWRTPAVTFGSGGWPLTLLARAPAGTDPSWAGWHGVSTGPYGVAIRQDNDWTVTLSHELLEMLANPDLVAMTASGAQLEVCDPVGEADYLLDGVRVADFVLPAWFSAPRSAKTDFASTLPTPRVVATITRG